MSDPFLSASLGAEAELPERLRQFAAPLRGAPAFDPGQVQHLADRLRLPGDARFEHPLLERVVRIGLAHIETTFQGDHPKYGVGAYADEVHDGFPPTLIAAVDALTLWEMAPRAEQLFAYWLRRFVRKDGAIDYYGPSLSEYGQLLTAARNVMDRGGRPEWLREHAVSLRRLADYLRAVLAEEGWDGLPRGVPEADERGQAAPYFHNSAWAVRGLWDWADLLEARLDQAEEARQVRQDASRLRTNLVQEIQMSWPSDPQEWWLSPVPEGWRRTQTESYWSRPERQITANRLGSYTNYRYWPELLYSGILPPAWMRRVVNARRTGGGQFCGATRFLDHLDDWPLADYLEGVWRLGMYAEYRLSLWGHILCHQADGHLTAYEQVSLPPGRALADYCLPCQLAAVRAARRIAGAS